MKIIFFPFIISLLIFTGCKKETSYVYDVNGVTVQQPGSGKSNVKTTNEFISIAYADLFGTSISQDILLKLNIAYTSFGDKKLVEDRIILNFLNDTTAIIPTNQTMRGDIPAFVEKSYKKFLNRTPNEFEKYFILNIIQSDTSVTPLELYYAMMTSNEYRYY